MSSEFLEDVSDDDNGNTVLLSMNAHRYAFLSLSGEQDEKYNYYLLPPNDVGRENAKKIVDALNA
jgi:hypothetical protein